MKIGLDVRMIGHSGIGTTIKGLLNNFEPAHFNSLHLFANEPYENSYPCEATIVPFPIYSLKQHWFYAKLLERQNIDLFHMPHFDVPYFYNKPFISTIHDLIHLKYPQFSTKPLSNYYAGLMLRKIAKTAKKIICVSENTKKDMAAYFPESEDRLVVNHPAVSDRYHPSRDEEIKIVLDRYGLSKGYLLYIGNLRGTKNSERLIEAYLELKKINKNTPDLVLAGKNFLRKYADKFPAGVRYLGVVDEDELAPLYSGAKIFIFPSLYEGFGLPPLEAMACGTPVVASNRASIPEVCGNTAIYIDPESVSDIVSKLNETLGASKERLNKITGDGLLNVKRFSWDKFANNTWNIYEDVYRSLNA